MTELELVRLLLGDSLGFRFHFEEFRLHPLDVRDSYRNSELDLLKMVLVVRTCLLHCG